jgi:hypothetical protein
VFSIVLGLLKLWPWRFAMVADGISYLDIASALSRSRWTELFNTYWGPLLPIITSVFLHIPRIHPFIALHLGLAVSYTCSVVAFSVFWAQAGEFSNDAIGRAHPKAWLFAGFTFFLLAFTPQIPNETPDMLVSAVVFLIAAILLRAGSDQVKPSDAFVLGVAAGVGYWAKAVMYPLGWLAVLTFVFVGIRNKDYMRAAVAISAFLIITTPLVIGVSAAAGRFTFGTSGQLNYAWIVDQNASSKSGANFFNGGQKVSDAPVIYQYPVKDGATFAPWYDPGKADNSKAYFSLGKQLRVLKISSRFLRNLFLSEHAPLVLGVVILGALEPKRLGRGLAQRTPVLIFALSGLTIYSLVILVYRYIVPFEVVLWGILFGAASVNAVSTIDRRVSVAALVGAVGLVFLNEVGGLSTVLVDLRKTQGVDQVKVAEVLKHDGIRPGDRIAVIGQALIQGWPHLTETPIEFEIPLDSERPFSMLPAERRQQILNLMRSAGVRYVVATTASPEDGAFRKIGGTCYSYLKP